MCPVGQLDGSINEVRRKMEPEYIFLKIIIRNLDLPRVKYVLSKDMKIHFKLCKECTIGAQSSKQGTYMGVFCNQGER